ncbi:hypothetical protein SAMN05660226_02977 [Parapedobacter luteus]|uniref:Uncharacterized protein n=1 Tax=Parapedobacter luteus TaxID=623280 RepID=A0A1T5DU04_9SPHI|nr:hypothetical protein SAMN05660226_02977 [Parapedobacter luteus]
MIFFGLDNPSLSANRVLIRANEGGHSVDSLTLRENFYGNLRQVNDRFTLFDSLKVVDTSETDHKDLVAIENGHIIDALPIHEQPDWLLVHMPTIAAKIRKE